MSNQIINVRDFQNNLAKETTKFKSVLPNHITPERFMRTIMTAVQSNPKILENDYDSIVDSAIRCAKDGLLPDGREAAFVPFKGKIQYIPMYNGILKRIRNSGLICSIEANIIHEHDYFKWIQGSDPKLEHIPLFPGERGEMIGVYAIAFYKGTNEKQFAVFDKNYIDEVMESKKNSKGEYPDVWVKHYNAMAQKTALRRLAKFLPMDAEISDLMDAGEYENALYTTVNSEPITIQNNGTGSSKLDLLAKQSSQTEEAQANA